MLRPNILTKHRIHNRFPLASFAALSSDVLKSGSYKFI